MTRDEKIERLIHDHHYNLRTAAAYVDSNCICAYCGDDPLVSRAGYWSAQIDHLLPNANYPDLEWEQANAVYSCSLCNNLKNRFDPYRSLRDKGVALDDPLSCVRSELHRRQLIDEVRQHLAKRLASEVERYSQIKHLIRG